MPEKEILIHNPYQNINHSQELKFEIKGPRHIFQTYSGIHTFDSLMKIIEGYKPRKILVNCLDMHGKTIVLFILNIKLRKYKLNIQRIAFRNNIYQSSVILLKFRSIRFE